MSHLGSDQPSAFRDTDPGRADATCTGMGRYVVGMTTQSRRFRVFDGHNDTLLALLENPDRDFGTRNPEGHIDVVRAREGNLVGGMFAMFATDRELSRILSAPELRGAPIPPLEAGPALRSTITMFALLRRLEAEGHLRICTSPGEVEAAANDGILAAVPHVEGAEAIHDVDTLEVLHALGLRSLGLVWSRPNAYATGVPFAYPGHPDVGPGLTGLGRTLVQACARLRIVVDVSHLNEAGFWDVLRYTDAPIVASHSNVHALTPSPRNLTNAQLDALAERDGLVGLNFARGFLVEGDANADDVGIDRMVRHLDAMVERLGTERVALGSDFDGAGIPRDIGDASGLPALFEALGRHGWDDETMQKVAFDNWMSLWRRVLAA